MLEKKNHSKNMNKIKSKSSVERDKPTEKEGCCSKCMFYIEDVAFTWFRFLFPESRVKKFEDLKKEKEKQKRLHEKPYELLLPVPPVSAEPYGSTSFLDKLFKDCLSCVRFRAMRTKQSASTLSKSLSFTTKDKHMSSQDNISLLQHHMDSKNGKQEQILNEKASSTIEVDHDIAAVKEKIKAIMKPDSATMRPRANNKVVSAKYTWYNFLFYCSYEQLTILSNFYFVVIFVVAALGSYTNYFQSPIPPTGTLLSLIIVVGFAMIFEGWYDYLRHVQDSRINSKMAKRIDSEGKVVECRWMDIKPGDVIIVEADSEFPADLLLLWSSDPAGKCYVQTAALDGETNLKLRFVPKELKEHCVNPEACGKLQAKAIYDAPNAFLAFQGTLNAVVSKKRHFEKAELINHIDVESQTDASIPKLLRVSLDFGNMLLRGSVLKNTHQIAGVVLYAGVETKAVQSTKKTKTKSSKMMKLITNVIIAILFVQLVMIVASAASYTFIFTPDQNFWYLQATGLNGSGYQFPPFWANFFTFIILYSNLVPISLILCVTISNVWEAMLVNWDIEMYYPNNDTPAKCITLELVQEIGQVSYVFSDKTGTLTRNEMKLVGCSVGGLIYGIGCGPDTTDFNSDSPFSDIFRAALMQMEDTQVLSSQSERLREFFAVMSVCHTVLVDEDDVGNIKYNAEGPDEEALVLAASKLGFRLVKTDNAVYEVEMKYPPKSHIINDVTDLSSSYRHGSANDVFDVSNGYHFGSVDESKERGDEKIYKYQVLATNPFNSTRKRMSMVVRCPNGKLLLMAKGADSMMFQRIRPPIANDEKECHMLLGKHLDNFANDGLRTLVFAVRTIDPEYFEEWRERYIEASTSLGERAENMAVVAEEIERELDVVGASAIEDRLQEGVPETLIALRDAGIKTWVLTGDKPETAINISFSAGLLTQNMHLVQLTSDNRDENIETLLELKNLLTPRNLQPDSQMQRYGREEAKRKKKLRHQRVNENDPYGVLHVAKEKVRGISRVPHDAALIVENYFATIGTRFHHSGLKWSSHHKESMGSGASQDGSPSPAIYKSIPSPSHAAGAGPEDHNGDAAHGIATPPTASSSKARQATKRFWENITGQSLHAGKKKANEKENPEQQQAHSTAANPPKQVDEALILTQLRKSVTWLTRSEKRAKGMATRRGSQEPSGTNANTSLLSVAVQLNDPPKPLEISVDIPKDGVMPSESQIKISHIEPIDVKREINDRQQSFERAQTPVSHDGYDTDHELHHSDPITSPTPPEKASPRSDHQQPHGMQTQPPSSTDFYRDNQGNDFENLAKELEATICGEEADLDGFEAANLALVVTGAALEGLLSAEKGDKVSETLLLDIAKLCKVVVACRVSPLQKSLMVRMVREGVKVNGKEPVTLAIGDGANDVAMIQAARIGVGIQGHEGSQAVNAADFAIGQFRFLQRLLLVHGRWNYRRMSMIVLYVFYSNLMFVLCSFWYNFLCNGSGTSLFSVLLLAIYAYPVNIPIIIVGCFNQDISAKTVLAYPATYISGRNNLHMGPFKMVEYISKAVIHTAIIMLTVLSLTVLVGDTVSINTLGTTVFFSCVTVALARASIETYTWTNYTIASITAGMLTFPILEPIFYASNSEIYTLYGTTVLYSPWTAPYAWLLTLFSVTVTVSYDLLTTYLRRMYFPTLVDMIIEIDRGMKDQEKDKVLDGVVGALKILGKPLIIPGKAVTDLLQNSRHVEFVPKYRSAFAFDFPTTFNKPSHHGSSKKRSGSGLFDRVRSGSWLRVPNMSVSAIKKGASTGSSASTPRSTSDMNEIASTALQSLVTEKPVDTDPNATNPTANPSPLGNASAASTGASASMTSAGVLPPFSVSKGKSHRNQEVRRNFQPNHRIRRNLSHVSEGAEVESSPSFAKVESLNTVDENLQKMRYDEIQLNSTKESNNDTESKKSPGDNRTPESGSEEQLVPAATPIPSDGKDNEDSIHNTTSMKALNDNEKGQNE